MGADDERALVRLAVAVMYELRNKDSEHNDAAVRSLMLRDISQLDALKLVCFVPSAFARIMLERRGATFPDVFVARIAPSGYVNLPYGLVPIYEAALTVARDVGKHGGPSVEEFELIAGLSPEFARVNTAISRGQDPKHLVMPPIVMSHFWADDFNGWTAFLRPEKTTIASLVREDLSSVCFVRDYVEFHFDGPVLRALTNPAVEIMGQSLQFPAPGSRDALCRLINRIVQDVDIQPDIHVELTFNGNATLTIPLDEASRGELDEAAHFVSEDGDLWIW